MKRGFGKGGTHRHQCENTAPRVCNACESLLVHEAIAEKFMPEIGKALQERKVEIRGDEATQGLVSGAVPATEADWATEYEDISFPQGW